MHYFLGAGLEINEGLEEKIPLKINLNIAYYGCRDLSEMLN